MPVDNNDLAVLNEQREQRRREAMEAEERKQREEMDGNEMMGGDDMERRPFLRNLFGNNDEQNNN
jgi:hypothetical protein